MSNVQSQQVANKSLNPQVSDHFSPLQELVRSALRRYGDFAPETVEGQVATLFLEFANLIIEDLRTHPYWQKAIPLYYDHVTEIRPIPDLIVINGLLFHYAMQQGSPKVQTYAPMYYQTMNQMLFAEMHGNKKIQLNKVDEH